MENPGNNGGMGESGTIEGAAGGTHAGQVGDVGGAGAGAPADGGAGSEDMARELGRLRAEKAALQHENETLKATKMGGVGNTGTGAQRFGEGEGVGGAAEGAGTAAGAAAQGGAGEGVGAQRFGEGESADRGRLDDVEILKRKDSLYTFVRKNDLDRDMEDAMFEGVVEKGYSVEDAYHMALGNRFAAQGGEGESAAGRAEAPKNPLGERGAPKNEEEARDRGIEEFNKQSPEARRDYARNVVDGKMKRGEVVNIKN